MARLIFLALAILSLLVLVGPAIWNRFHLGLVPLPRAVIMAYDQTEHAMVVGLGERMDKNRQKTPAMMAHLLVGNNLIPIFGRHPPSSLFKKIRTSAAAKYQFAEDAASMVHPYQEDDRYVDLAIRRSDLRRRIKELIAMGTFTPD